MRNHTLTNATDTAVNITQPELKENHLNESTTTLTNTTREVKPQLELVPPSNTTNQSSSTTPPTEPIKNELNITDSSSDTNITNEGVTSTASPPSLTTPLNTHEIFPPTISSPWLKGMLVNTKSLPELFKIIEKLNFNLTLSNRYLQELSQHYVKKLDETQQTTDLLLKASKAADAQVRTGVRPCSLFYWRSILVETLRRTSDPIASELRRNLLSATQTGSMDPIGDLHSSVFVHLVPVVDLSLSSVAKEISGFRSTRWRESRCVCLLVLLTLLELNCLFPRFSRSKPWGARRAASPDPV